MDCLTQDFFERDTVTVSRDLLGRRLVRVLDDGSHLSGRIVETEAYYGEGDPPSHASSGRTGRSKIMWDKPGLAYVYLIYGIHIMLNVVTEPEGTPGAVLIRAVEPLEGLSEMEENRGGVDKDELTDGPGKLTRAFRIGMDMNDEDLLNSGKLWLSRGNDIEENQIDTSGRIGVSQGKEEQLRFFLTGNRFVSCR